MINKPVVLPTSAEGNGTMASPVPPVVVEPITNASPSVTNVEAVVDTHLGTMSQYGNEAGAWLAEKIKVLKADLSFEVADVEAAVRAWKEKHLHNSPVSQNTSFWNALQPKLAALVAELRNVGKS